MLLSLSFLPVGSCSSFSSPGLVHPVRIGSATSDADFLKVWPTGPLRLLLEQWLARREVGTVVCLLFLVPSSSVLFEIFAAWLSVSLSP